MLTKRRAAPAATSAANARARLGGAGTMLTGDAVPLNGESAVMPSSIWLIENPVNGRRLVGAVMGAAGILRSSR
jgi:hypothetical protein